MKTCPNCNKTKSLEDFYKEKECAGGYRKICKLCRDIEVNAYRKKNRLKINARYRAYNKKHYQKLRLMRYKLKEEQYDKMLLNQNNLCALCFKPPVGRYPLAIDHDHQTGIVRGLLCHSCNRAMVVVDNPEMLERCINYRRKYIPR